MSQEKPVVDRWQVNYLYDSSSSYTVGDPSVGGSTAPNADISFYQGVTPAAPEIPQELKVCVVCGVDDVLIFCDACKEVIREARKQWAKDFLEEIENALS